MKRLSFFSVLALILVSFTFVSCLSSGKGMKYDAFDYMTVRSDGVTIYEMIGDSNGQIYIPENPESLQMRDKNGIVSYPERARIFFTFVKDASAGKKSMTPKRIKIEATDLFLPVKEFNFEKDTLIEKKLDHSFTDVAQPWGASNYITFIYSYDHESKTTLDNFDLYVEEVNESTIKLRFNDSRNFDDLQQNLVPGLGAVSYELPDRMYFNRLNPNFEPFGPNNDSIHVQVEANIRNEGVKSFKKFTMKLGRSY